MPPDSSAPTVSIIIATYNWSAALRCALRSIARQTFGDFEVLVVGDARTNDSEAVIASFGDTRFRWHNLAKNHGGQWGPNNHGLKTARGQWVAYLGHDDIWYPTHLEACLRTAREQDADLVAGVAALYGPPRSEIYAVTGLLGAEIYSAREFFPPSSILHRRSLVDRVGYWKAPKRPMRRRTLSSCKRLPRRVRGSRQPMN